MKKNEIVIEKDFFLKVVKKVDSLEKDVIYLLKQLGSKQDKPPKQNNQSRFKYSASFENATMDTQAGIQAQFNQELTLMFNKYKITKLVIDYKK